MRNKHILVLLFSFVLFSCDNGNNPDTVIDIYIDAYIVDKDGNDLLDPNKHYAQSVELENLDVVYLKNDKEEICYNSESDAPRGFLRLPPDEQYDKYILRIFPNSNYKNSITYLKWNELDIDTLSVEIHKTETSTICIGVELNGEFVWGVKHNNIDKTRRLITITK